MPVTEEQKLVGGVLGERAARELLGVGYRPALPVTPQDFSLGGVLPAVLYMMRWGHRRGAGRFDDVFGEDGAATIASVAATLARDEKHFVGFTGEGEGLEAILGDLLLAFCLENRRHRPGREEPVQRALPTHYFASWVDLPKNVSDLRFVPELIVALLARQDSGDIVTMGGKGRFPLGPNFRANLLLKLLGPGTEVVGQQHKLEADRFCEDAEDARIGLDQLLTVRLAQHLMKAPMKRKGQGISGAGSIANQCPLAQRAADDLYEDVNVFLRFYGPFVPRQSLLPMLEVSLSLGLTGILLSALRILQHWGHTGEVLPRDEQRPWALFVDGSNSTDPRLRECSEERVDGLLLALDAFPAHMMCLRVLRRYADAKGLSVPPPAPDPRAHVEFLGDLLFERAAGSDKLEERIEDDCRDLAHAIAGQDGGVENGVEGGADVLAVLSDGTRHPAWRMADSLVALMGRDKQTAQYRKHAYGCTMADEPNGMVHTRMTATRGDRRERWSVVLGDVALDFLVHRHLRGANRGTRPKPLPMGKFIRIIRDRYGLYIEEAPPGMAISRELLQKNRALLERRLRDLGLFRGVSDAESMKRLQERYEGGRDDAD